MHSRRRQSLRRPFGSEREWGMGCKLWVVGGGSGSFLSGRRHVTSDR